MPPKKNKKKAPKPPAGAGSTTPATSTAPGPSKAEKSLPKPSSKRTPTPVSTPTATATAATKSSKSSPAPTDNDNKKNGKKEGKPKGENANKNKPKMKKGEKAQSEANPKTAPQKKQDTAKTVLAPKPTQVNGIPIPEEAFDLTHLEGTGEKPSNKPDEFKIHGRVDYGTRGTKVDVLTNQILISAGDDVTNYKHSEADPWWRSAYIYTYHIDFKPPEKKGPRRGPPQALSKPKKYELLDALFHEDETLFKYKDRIAFNGEETLYSHVPLEEFTLFKGCWDVSNKQKKKISVVGLQKGKDEPVNELASQIVLKFASKVNLSDIYKATLNQNPEEQENKMTAPEKTVLLSLLGVKYMQSDDPIFQLQGNKFFIYNKDAVAMPFQMGAYLLHGFTVSLRYVYGAVLLNTINVCLPFYKHTKYLPGDPKFSENAKTPYTLMDWIIECYEANNAFRGYRTKGPVTSSELNTFIERNRELKDLVRGLKVYRPYINYSVNPDGSPKPPKKMQPKGIVGFARETAASLKFKALPSDVENAKAPRPGEREIMISTEQYFAKKYNIKLKYPDVKLVSLGGRNVVPAEALIIVPGQKLKGLIRDENTVKDFTALRPIDKFRAITNLALPAVRNALSPEEQDAKAPHDSPYTFLKVPSRIIDAPVVQFKDSTVKYVDKPFGTKEGKTFHEETKGNWNLKNHKFVSPPAEEWKLRAIYINDNERAPPASVLEDLKNSLNKFKTDVATVGVRFDTSGAPILINNFGPPERKVIGGGGRGGSGRGGRGGRGGGRGGRAPRGEVVYEISPGEQKLCQLLKTIPPKTYLLFILNSANNSGVYNRLKFLADLTYGVLNNCVVWSSFRKNSTQYNVNVVMKMNLKLQGVNHTLSEEDISYLKDKDTGLPFMVLGADVTHYPEKDQNSIASLVGSFDSQFAQFPGDYMLQSEPGEEIISGIGNLIRDRLKLYQQHNGGKLPPKVLFYRDGVSETQFSQVVKIEVKNLKLALKRFGAELGKDPKYNPSLTTIAVVKRNQIRFMPLQENALNEKGELVAVQSMGNVMPGTVVDRGITSSAHFDFFLQSQQPLKGTGVPCHYWCIYDENMFNSDYLQRVTHSLCYLFGRSSTSIKVASPVYYADCLCERGAQFFKANFDVAKHEFAKERGGKSDAIPAAKLLPPIHDNVKNVMYYI